VTTYNVRLLETRMSDCSGDDAAIFSVSSDDDGTACQVATLISPLFRHLYMESNPPIEARRDMVAGMGAQAIAEQVKRGIPLEDGAYLLLSETYPGAPADPQPVPHYEEWTFESEDGKRVRKE
jgi:hypothetical protein